LELHPTAFARECHEHCPIAEQLTKSEQFLGTMMARRIATEIIGAGGFGRPTESPSKAIQVLFIPA